MNHPRPRLLVSRCLGFDHCRYDGGIRSSLVVEKLRPFCQVQTVCPEADSGLETPRPAADLYADNTNRARMVQSTTQRDLTELVESYCDSMSTDLDIDGAVLKAKSPSCGVDSARIFQPDGSWLPGKGILPRLLSRQWPWLPLADEKALEDHHSRHHFLSNLFVVARLRQLGPTPDPVALEEFHRCHKYWLMARSPHDLKQLGRLVATGDRDVFGTYRSQLRKVVAQPSHRGRIVNALQHMAGYFSPGSHQQEKWQQRVQEFLDGLVAEEELLQMLRHWQREQPREYISMQVLLWPYPSNLISK